MAKLVKFSRLKGNRSPGTRWWRQVKSGSGNMAVSCMRNASDHTGVTRVGVTLYFLKTDDLF